MALVPPTNPGGSSGTSLTVQNNSTSIPDVNNIFLGNAAITDDGSGAIEVALGVGAVTDGISTVANVGEFNFITGVTVTNGGTSGELNIVDIAINSGAVIVTDGTTTVNPADTITVVGGTVTDGGGGNAEISGFGGGGGGNIATIVAGGISGSATLEAIPNLPLIVKPTFTTWLNQGSLTITDNPNGPLTLEMPVMVNTDNIRTRYKSVPVGAFTLDANWTYIGLQGTSVPTMGLILTDGTKTAIYEAGYGRTFPQFIDLNVWNTTTSGGSGIGGTFVNVNLPDTIWQRIAFDGTVTYTFSFSYDGFTWRQTQQANVSALTFTPTGIGIGMSEFVGGTSIAPLAMSLNNWNGA